MSPLRRLGRILEPEWKDIAATGVFAAVIGVLNLATPLAVEALVNTIAFGRLLQPLFVLCGMLFVFLAFAASLRLIQAWVAEIIQRRIFVRIVADLAWRIPRVEQAALDRKHAPELMNRFFDVMTVQKSAALLVLDGVAIALQTLIGMTILAFYHPIFLGFDVILLILLGGMVLLLGRGAVTSAIGESKAKYETAAWLQQLAFLSTSFKTQNGARQSAMVADELAIEYLSCRRKHFGILMRQIGFALVLQAVAGSALLGIGGWLVIQGQISLGQLVAAELIIAVILGSFAKLGKHVETFYDLLAAVDKLGHLLDLPVERQSAPVRHTAIGPATVEVKRVTFAFPDSRPIFPAQSFAVASGEMVVLRGPPGGGKSTLLDLLYALRRPTSGSVEIDGIDLRDLTPGDTRLRCTLLREVEIISVDIFQNITFGRDEISPAMVYEVLRELGVQDAFAALPEGLHTKLAPGGSPLSATESILLLLARALVARPGLLLIDHLLDTLDNATLARVVETLRGRRGETTILLVTSRDALLDAADRVIDLKPADSDANPAADVPLQVE